MQRQTHKIYSRYTTQYRMASYVSRNAVLLRLQSCQTVNAYMGFPFSHLAMLPAAESLGLPVCCKVIIQWGKP